MICGFSIDYILKVFFSEALQSFPFLAAPLVLLLLTLTICLPTGWRYRTADFSTIHRLYFAVFLFSLAVGGLSNWCVDYL